MPDGGPASACDIPGRPILGEINAAGRAAASYDRVHSQSLMERDLTDVSLSSGHSRVFPSKVLRTASSFSWTLLGSPFINSQAAASLIIWS
jgi:hypothetical protein